MRKRFSLRSCKLSVHTAACCSCHRLPRSSSRPRVARTALGTARRGGKRRRRGKDDEGARKDGGYVEEVYEDIQATTEDSAAVTDEQSEVGKREIRGDVSPASIAPMSYSRLPGSSSPGSPLLGDPVPRPRRLLRFVLALSAALVLLILIASRSSISTSFDPIKDSVGVLRQDDTPVQQAEATALQHEPERAEEEEVVIEEEEPLPARVEWSEEDQQLQKYSWKTPEVHESLERQLEAMSPVRPAFIPLFPRRQAHQFVHRSSDGCATGSSEQGRLQPAEHPSAYPLPTLLNQYVPRLRPNSTERILQTVKVLVSSSLAPPSSTTTS
jgi:hypothetical protein